MAQDKLKPNLTFSELDKLEKPEVFIYTTKSSKRVVFPDIFDMDAMQAEEFLRDMAGKQWNSEVLKKWLDPEDYEKLMEDHLTLRQLNFLTERVQAHYEGSLGSSGEGVAS